MRQIDALYQFVCKNVAVIAAYHKKTDNTRIWEVFEMLGLDDDDKKALGNILLK